jgi:hypothetical protein
VSTLTIKRKTERGAARKATNNIRHGPMRSARAAAAFRCNARGIAMNASIDPLLPPERKLSGATLAGAAFVTGTLFALLPMYYVYSSHERTPAAAPSETPEVAVADAPSAGGAREAPVRFASRMTYELSRTPAEPLQTVRVASNAQSATAPVPIPPPLDAAPRVPNARPILATPPDPRDTTRAMEKEARRGQLREAPRQAAQLTLEPAQPRVIEGRDLALPPKAVATRPISAADAEEPKRSAEAPADTAPVGRAQVATAAVVSGASPIAAPPEVKVIETQKPRPQGAAGDVLGARLTATRDWLSSASRTTHTIQLMGSSSEENLRARLQALAKVLDPGRIYVFRTVAQGKPSMTVLYGAFPDRQAALQAMEKLPPAIAGNRPVLRTVSGIRAEQERHRAGAQDSAAGKSDAGKS